MSILAKAGLGVAALGGIGIAGCYAMGVFGETTTLMSAPEWVSMIGEANASGNTNTYTSGKVGKDYARYLVGVHGAPDANNNANEAWWKWSHKRYLSDEAKNVDFSTEFGKGKVKGAYEKKVNTQNGSAVTSEGKPLNKVCEDIYKKNAIDISFSEIVTGDNDEAKNKKKLARDLLKYCSPLGQKPVSIKDTDGYTEGSVGKTTQAQDTNPFTSTKDNANDGFWEAQNKWFKALGTTDSTDLFFKTYKDNESQTVKKACEAAYQSTATNGTATASAPVVTDVTKYCSFKEETN